MKRTLFVLVLGLAAGIGAHTGWLAAFRPADPRDPAVQLAWMKTHLNLNEVQAAQLRALHERTAPRLLALAAEVASMQTELEAFERARENEGRIDFLEFARFVAQRRQLDADCARSTEQLVAAASAFMTPDQREHYRRLIDPTLKAQRAGTIN